MPADSWPRCCSACRPEVGQVGGLRVAYDSEDAAHGACLTPFRCRAEQERMPPLLGYSSMPAGRPGRAGGLPRNTASGGRLPASCPSADGGCLRSLLPLALADRGCRRMRSRPGTGAGGGAERAPVVPGQARAEGSLRAGAAKVALAPPFPVVVAGYSPPRPEASQADPPLHARAVVLARRARRAWGWCPWSCCSVHRALVAAVRERAAGLGLQRRAGVGHAHALVLRRV